MTITTLTPDQPVPEKSSCSPTRVPSDKADETFAPQDEGSSSLYVRMPDTHDANVDRQPCKTNLDNCSHGKLVVTILVAPPLNSCIPCGSDDSFKIRRRFPSNVADAPILPPNKPEGLTRLTTDDWTSLRNSILEIFQRMQTKLYVFVFVMAVLYIGVCAALWDKLNHSDFHLIGIFVALPFLPAIFYVQSITQRDIKAILEQQQYGALGRAGYKVEYEGVSYSALGSLHIYEAQGDCANSLAKEVSANQPFQEAELV